MQRRLRAAETTSRARITTPVIPVLVAKFGGPVPFLPQLPIGGCTCIRAGRAGILLHTVSANRVVVDGVRIKRGSAHVIPSGTSVMIGGRAGKLHLLSVPTVFSRPPAETVR
ncbi:MAG: hypothetical protein WC734_04410 [Patescibacteria group bacterium]